MTNPRGMPGPPPLGLNIDWCIMVEAANHRKNNVTLYRLQITLIDIRLVVIVSDYVSAKIIAIELYLGSI